MKYNTLATLHVMWYESQMINETLDSIQQSIDNADRLVQLVLCLNSQTYIETPDEGVDPEKAFDIFLDHPLLKDAIIIRKTDQDPFYNIGDWAREIYGGQYNARYTVWLESDCLVPEDYFFLLENIDIEHPHTISLANRKMWDSSWDEIEHPHVQTIPRTGPPEEPQRNTPEPWGVGHYINQKDLNDFNKDYEPLLIKLSQPKVDGAMTAISNNFPYPFIAEGVHIGGHDYYMEMFMKKHNIPQYHISTRLKGHNCTHPKKRLGTSTPRGGKIYKKYEKQCNELIYKLIHDK
jgi:hypothetical protein